ncbi:smg-4 upf3 family protein [Cystoisospora suis]|uniref:Smg-4 upf3 family protein n=1 Tax=Cystoisospora suis TaxID=483139 RepID=A0A2C6KUJ9_9APIC|nr:smg-4 upf3 family protein [Cystoisospora suis]
MQRNHCAVSLVLHSRAFFSCLRCSPSLLLEEKLCFPIMPPRGVIYRPRALQPSSSLSADAPLDPESTPVSFSSSPSAIPTATVSKAPTIIPSFILTKQQLVPAKKISPPVRSRTSSTSNESTNDVKGKSPSVSDTPPHSSKSATLLSQSVPSSSSVAARQAKSPSFVGRHGGGGSHRHSRVREPFLGASALSGQHHQLVWKSVNSNLPSPKKSETEGEYARVKGARKTGSSLTAVATLRDKEDTDKGRASPSPKKGDGGGGSSRELREQEREEEDHHSKGRLSSSEKKKESSIYPELPPNSEGRREEETKTKRSDLGVDGSGSRDRSGGEGKVPADIQASAPDGVHAITQTYKSKSETKVVVRLLPPSVTEEDLLALLSDSSLKEKIAWSRFFSGRQGDVGGDKPSRNSVWYLNFSTAQDANDFIQFFHGKPFVDERHNTYKAVARLAPYQKTPRKKPTDKREGTLEDASVYVDFLEKLKNGQLDEPPPPSPGTEELEVIKDDDGVVLSSLVLAMRQKYGVKTLVQGKPYTLATWRKRFCLQSLEGEGDGSEEEEESAVANPRPVPTSSKKGKSERGKGKKISHHRDGSEAGEKRERGQRDPRERTSGTGPGFVFYAPRPIVDKPSHAESTDHQRWGASSAEKTRSPTETTSDSRRVNRGEGDRDSNSHNVSVRVMSRALLGIQKRPQAGGGGEDGDDHRNMSAGSHAAAGATERRQGQNENGRRREGKRG